MDIIVCIKQVTPMDHVTIDPTMHTLIREGKQGMINPFDTYAIEEAIRIREKAGGTVTVISMGIPSASETLREAIALGVDNAILLSDPLFAGADTLATSYTLSMAIRRIGTFDLIICGRQSVDGDTGQVGPSLAEKLSIPHIPYVSSIEELGHSHIRCSKMNDKGYEVVNMCMPGLITVVKEINQPRLTTIKGMLRAKKAVIKIWNSEDIYANPQRCGMQGSPTQVISTYQPTYESNNEMIKGDSLQEKVQNLVSKLYGGY